MPRRKQNYEPAVDPPTADEPDDPTAEPSSGAEGDAPAQPTPVAREPRPQPQRNRRRNRTDGIRNGGHVLRNGRWVIESKE